VKPLSPKDPVEIAGFTLVGRLGKGGMGVVYLASRKSDSVALKVIRDSLLDDDVQATRFTREVSILEKIKSPNVARILEAGVDEGTAWFAVEFVNGPNLSELVADKGPLDEDKWWELAEGLLNGLADVHKRGVIHRDIKPANVIMAEMGPKLIDFGIAHVSDATSVTATGLVAGSPAWFSPEQIEGLELTPATDVFSAGSLLTFAATGSSPWGGETTMTKASVFKILTSEPDLSGLSPEQQALVSLMLEKEPAKRTSALEALKSLIGSQNGGVITSGTGVSRPPQVLQAETRVLDRSELSFASVAPRDLSTPQEEAGRSVPLGTRGKLRPGVIGGSVAGAFLSILLVVWGGVTTSECLNTSEYDEFHDRYLVLRDDARLTGEQELQHTEWRIRSLNLQNMLEAETERVRLLSELPMSAQYSAEEVERRVADLGNAYSELAQLAGEHEYTTIPDNDWQEVWDAVYQAEYDLELATSNVCRFSS
jgi:serine/threonine protein kinase